MRVMLGLFRERIVKWGAQLLFVLLILSFVAWGIGDYLGYQGGGSGSQTVAEVGGRSIATRDFQREMQDQVARMRQMFGDTFNIEQARAMGIEESVLQNMIHDALFSEGASRLGLVVDDAVVAQEIRSDPSFQTSGGAFNRDQFNSALRQAGFSEGQYIALMRGEILRRQYLSPVLLGRDVPRGAVESLYKFRNEKRVAQIITLPHSMIKDVPAPTEEDLVKYHDENKKLYTTEEVREITLVRMRPEDIADEIDVPEDEIQRFYDDHIVEFSSPEHRTISQTLFPDEAAARAAYDRITKGEDYAKIEKEFGGGTLGSLSKSEVPIPELGEAAFAALPDTVTEPVASPLGWHLVQVTNVIPASKKDIKEVHDDIRHRIALEKAADSLYGLAGKFEDELGGGASAEEAAKRLKLNVTKIDSIDREGRDPAGNHYNDMTPEILRAAFEAPAGGDSPLGDLPEGGHYVVHVDKIMPAAVRPLDEVKDRVRADWLAAKRAERAETIIKEMVAEIKDGKLLADIVKPRGANIMTTKPFSRTRQGLDLQVPSSLVAALFKSKPGTPESGAGEEAHMIGIVTDVIVPDVDADKEAVSRLKDELGTALANDLSTSLAAALRERLKVTIDRTAIEKAF
jgi:peptidyl-prolyl cis-trans isomerase D